MLRAAYGVNAESKILENLLTKYLFQGRCITILVRVQIGLGFLEQDMLRWRKGKKEKQSGIDEDDGQPDPFQPRSGLLCRECFITDELTENTAEKKR